MHLTDRVPLGDVRETVDGYLVGDAKIARAGVQIYAGHEVGQPNRERVRVWRPEAEVFSAAAMTSFAHRPVTDDHPDEPVSALNWKRHAVGMTGDQVARDGGFIRVPMILMDRAAISAVRGGKRELSCGYSCDLRFETGTTPEGEPYDAVQRNIRGNHLAIVAMGRAGAACRLGDGQERQSEEEDLMKLQRVILDGGTVDLPEVAAIAVAALRDGLEEARRTLALHDKALASRDAEIEKLRATQIDPARFDALVTERAELIGRARAIVADLDVNGLDASAIRRVVVTRVLGDGAVANRSDDYVEARFDLIGERTGDPVRPVISNGIQSDASTVGKAHRGMVDFVQSAWKAPSQKGAA
ncbi:MULTISPECIES: DUF2213 domain-containing protein [unclassified Beijerinckia]|uniref:DUF2213 domain-containing protein n=1 Tax=unclassified Beijerinckia TaxID=2638183 RepID=UPI00089AC25D|nr:MULTISPECIES: DUF2213 domain-containing protein [unclassified Beijerinckia]MDH7794109.1 hypothetical protein [Beijerinckia sp. GAS462]SEB53507.1 hypothetical protein SAMN05443249_0375 [Beijerinckia sp. 28-YEA-48]